MKTLTSQVFAVILVCVLFTFPSLANKRQSGKVIGEGKERARIQLTSPKGGWTVDRMVRVAGSVSDTSIDPITISINGKRYLVRTNSGRFDRKFPASSGKNTVLVQGTNKAGITQVKRSFFAKVPTVPLMAILTSDTDGVYTDLHIYEPKSDLENPVNDSKDEQHHIYWASTSSPTGGKFYLNEQSGSYDQPGYGPYLYTHRSPPLGVYRIDANYWPSGDKAHTLATLNVVLFGGSSKEVSRNVKLPLAMSGETITMAFVRIDKGQQAHIYVPLRDTKPKNTKIWPKWVIDFNPRKTSGSSYY